MDGFSDDSGYRLTVLEMERERERGVWREGGGEQRVVLTRNLLHYCNWMCCYSDHRNREGVVGQILPPQNLYTSPPRHPALEATVSAHVVRYLPQTLSNEHLIRGLSHCK